MLMPDTCPTCTRPVAAHFDPLTGVFRGCPTPWQALTSGPSGGLARICVRVWRKGDRAGEPIVCFPDHLDEAGNVLAWDHRRDRWETIAGARDMGKITRRADHELTADARDAVEQEIGQKVRVVLHVIAASREKEG